MISSLVIGVVVPGIGYSLIFRKYLEVVVDTGGVSWVEVTHAEVFPVPVLTVRVVYFNDPVVVKSILSSVFDGTFVGKPVKVYITVPVLSYSIRVGFLTLPVFRPVAMSLARFWTEEVGKLKSCSFEIVDS